MDQTSARRELAKLVKFGEIPVQLSTEYEHIFADDEVGPENSFRLSVKVLFPGPGGS